MKINVCVSILIVFLFVACCSQSIETDSGLNLNFEILENGMPKDWVTKSNPGYSVSLDSTDVKSGKYSIAIGSTGDSAILFYPIKTSTRDSINAQQIAFTLPNNYDGEKISLSGYIKTENIEDFAGLCILIKGMSPTEFTATDLEKEGVTGTLDWVKYEVTLDLDPIRTQQIIIGVLLVGKGKIWIDDLQVTIDGIDIKDAKVYEKKPLPAELDRALLSSKIIIPLSDKLTSKEDKALISNLELLGKLWGFLKYHHPEVGKGNYNWDNELFRILPEYLEVNETAKRDDILLRWIEKYGEIPECKTCRDTLSNTVLKPDLSWIDNFNMSLVLKEKIKEVYKNRHQGEQFYLKTDKYVGNPVFDNEVPYSLMRYPDTGLRLLALYRYWNMIQYFFPYKHLTDKNWSEVLKEYIPKFVSAKTELEYQLTVLQLTGEINDSHANLKGVGDKVDLLRGNWQAPFKVRFIENELVVMEYYKPELKDSTCLNVGDIITHINGKSIESIIDSIKIYYPASNEAIRKRNMANDLVRSVSKTLSIDYVSSDQIKYKTELTLYDKKSLNTNKKSKELCYRILGNNNILVVRDLIGYITLETIKREDIDNIKKTFGDNTKGIIIDIRNYPSMFVPFLLGSYFVSEDTPFAKFSRVNINNPGEFSLMKEIVITKSENTYKGKLVVLVNEESISQSEYTAMAFQAGRNTTIIGSQTAGADGNVSVIELPGGLSTGISGVGIYYPDGRETQRIGIVPDIEVKPTIQGIREGRDELLEKAIEIIRAE